MNNFKIFFANIFPSNPEMGVMGSLKLNIWLANITGIPIVVNTESYIIKWLILVYGIFISLFVTFVYTGFEIYDLTMNLHDLDKITQNICLTLTHVTGAIKIMNLLYRSKDFKIVIEQLKYVTKTYTKSKEQIESFYYGELENKIVLCIYFSVVGTTGLLGMVLLFWHPELIAGEIFPYRVLLPASMPIFLQLIYMGLSVMIFAIQIVAVDYLNVNIINQIRFQLNILNLSFDELTVMTSDVESEQRQLDFLKDSPVKRLNSIVEHHCLLREIRQTTEDIFSPSVLLQFFTSLMIFALTGFQATVRSGGSNAAILIYFYCGCIFCQLFVYCWFGNEVFEQSKTLSARAFSSSWYLFDRHCNKSLSIFLTNAQRPFMFTAGGFMSLSLPSFAGILSKSYSYLAVLRQTYAR